MSQIDTSTDRTADALRWNLPNILTLIRRTKKSPQVPGKQANSSRPDRFTLSRDVADGLALRSGTRSGNW